MRTRLSGGVAGERRANPRRPLCRLVRTFPAFVRSDTLKKVVRLSFVLPTQARGGLTTTKRPTWGVLSVWGAPGATGQPRLWRVVVVVAAVLPWVRDPQSAGWLVAAATASTLAVRAQEKNG